MDNLKLADLRSDLDTIRQDLDRLLAMAKTAGVGRRRRFGQYLDILDRKQADMHVALDQVVEAAKAAASRSPLPSSSARNSSFESPSATPVT